MESSVVETVDLEADGTIKDSEGVTGTAGEDAEGTKVT